MTDAVQLSLGPVGWFLLDEGLDVLAMVLTSAALGFHMLLLPTFVIELLPVADMLPTWTACTAAVVVLRKNAQNRPASAIVAPPKIIDAASPPAQLGGEKKDSPSPSAS